MRNKLLLMVLSVLLIGALAACGDTSDNEGNKNNNTEDQTNNNDNNANGEDGNADDNTGSAEAGSADNPAFDEVIALLANKGFEIGEVDAHDDMTAELFDGEDAAGVQINGDEDYPLFIIEMDPDHENLEGAEERGTMPMYFEGEEADQDVLVKGNLVFFLAALHDDQPEVLQTLEEEL